ncbi:MAG TPA: PQQ-binding-like beta-propeller repeat protein, partial [Gemmataceae bacterium]|nr:PQQ-binding-like beta-propeller repeat protein [Gemmataceae bacterium]
RHFGPLRDHLYFNRLRAIDLETGKIIWEVGGRGDGELADCYFLGPPLPLDGRLHVLIEKKSELRLVCLGAERGNILWTQTLANYRDHILLDARRRVQAAHLSYDDGILVCSTNAGMLFGVELLTRSLLWVYSYRTPAAPDAAPPPPVPLQAVSTSWRTSAPILHGGKVVFTAPDADAVHCLHLRDGLPVWKAGRTDDDLYLAGVFKDRVLLVGKQNCRALSLADGKPLWQLATGTPSGQGVGAGPVYFLPLQKGAVCAIDVERGAVAGSAESRSGEVPGNLILHDGDLLSQTALQLTAYPQLRVRLGQINERLARDPCDPSALADRGALRLDQGDLPGAAADLRAALAGQPPAELLLRVQAKLFDALTQWLRRDFAAAEKYLDEYHQLSEVPIPENAPAEQVWKLRQERDRRLAAYYVVLARGREQQGRLSEALAAYRRLHDLARDGQPIPAADNPSGRVRPDVWVEGRTAALLARASPEQRRAVEEQIDREWRALRATADTDALERFVALFGSACAAGREARLELAERLTQDHDRGRFLEAELLLLPLCEQRDDPVLAARAVETLARLLLRKGLPEDAMHYYRILARDFAPVVVRGGQTGADLVNALTADKRLLAQVHEGPPPWVPGRIKAVDEPVNAPPRLTALVLLPEGEMPPSYRGRQLLLDVNSSRLVIADQRTGATVWSRGLALGPHRHHLRGLIPSERSLSFHLVGHLAVLHLGHMVCAVDLIERRMLWQRPLLEAMISPEQVAFRSGPGNSQRAWAIGEAGQPAGVSRLAVVGPAVVCVQMPRRLVALDPARGDVLWTRTDLGPTVEFFSDQEHVYAVQPDVGSTHVLRARDGTVREAPPFAPEYRDRLAVVEGKLLVGQIDPEGNCTLRLYDVASGKDVWKRTFPANAIFLRAPDAELAGVLDPTGKFVVFEAATGKELVKGAVDPKHLSNVEEVYLLHDRTQFYLAFHGPINPATRIAEEPVPNLLNSRPGVPVNGMLYAFNRNTGELSWANRLTGQFIVREHLADLPVLLCTARYPRRKADGNLVMVAATCSFDKQTGKLLYNKEVVEPEHGSPGLPPTLFHTLHVDPRTGTIELIAPRLKVHHFPRTRE